MQLLRTVALSSMIGMMLALTLVFDPAYIIEGNDAVTAQTTILRASLTVFSKWEQLREDLMPLSRKAEFARQSSQDEPMCNPIQQFGAAALAGRDRPS
jgi:hypothetical protein